MSELPAQKEADEVKTPDAVSGQPNPKGTTDLKPAVIVPPPPAPAPIQQPGTENGKNEFKKETASTVEFITLFLGVIGLGILIWQTILLQEANASTKASVDLTRQQMILSERAWVANTQVTANYTVDENSAPVAVSFSIEIKNTGGTPAINVVPVISYYADFKKIPAKDVYPSPVYHSMLLPPDVTAEIPPPIGPYQNTYGAIKSGAPFYIAGTVFYEDIFGKRHWTQFCQQITSDFTSKPMPFHNTCDDAEANKSD